jgi:signal transduction histidine kinase
VLALVTLVVAGLVAGFVLLRYRADLDRAIDEGLETRYADVRAALRRVPRPVAGDAANIIPKTEVFAQVLTRDGEILAASPRALREEAVLSPRELARASHKRMKIEQPVPLRTGSARLLVGPERLGSQHVVVVVGSRLADSERSEQQLERALAIALPGLVVCVVIAGWFLVGAALRPVGKLVSEADALSANAEHRRLSIDGPTELADLATHLNVMLDRIEAALEHERAFLDDASHELRTPIAIVRGELELARPLAARDPALRAALDSSLEEVERLQELALHLLGLGRARAATPPNEPVDLRAVCDRALDALRRAGDPPGVEVTLRGSAETVGDAAGLERAVANLFDNAVRHATSRVEIELGERDDDAYVEVRDDGPGFPREVLEHAGQRFVPGAVSGAGLGLAIVDAIAGSHEGHLELGARAGGGGAVVTLHLPRQISPPD